MFRDPRGKAPPILIPPHGQQPASHGRRRRRTSPHRRRPLGRIGIALLVVLVLLAGGFGASAALRWVRGTRGITVVAATPRPVVRLAHPCLADAVARSHVAGAPGQPPSVDLVAVPNDVGTRVYVGDTVRGTCLGLVTRTLERSWLAYRADSVAGTFVQSPDTTPTAASAAATLTGAR